MTDLPRHLDRPRLRRKEASQYLDWKFGINIAPATLAKMASVGGGPRYHKFGRVPLYPLSELNDWAEQRLGRLLSSSSDAGDDAA